LPNKKKRSIQFTTVCLICGTRCEYLPTHLRYSHDDMTIDEYLDKYPQAYAVSSLTAAVTASSFSQEEWDIAAFLDRPNRPYLNSSVRKQV